MSKSVIRIAFSILISILVIAGVYTSVLGAPLGANQAGSHLVSGAMVNLDHYRLSAPDPSFGAFDGLSTHQEGGHGCGADKQTSSPDD
jgi:hypothetical protein